MNIFRKLFKPAALTVEVRLNEDDRWEWICLASNNRPIYRSLVTRGGRSTANDDARRHVAFLRKLGVKADFKIAKRPKNKPKVIRFA